MNIKKHVGESALLHYERGHFSVNEFKIEVIVA